MSNFDSKKSKFSTSIALALSLSLSSAAFADGVNATVDGGTVASGTYYNTPGGKTTFSNNGGSGDLHLPNGNVVRGLELGSYNGGTLHFYAPGGIVRLDGSVDVSALKSGQAYMGNGGRVFVDSAFLFQNGTIFANGINGGAVQFNVGAAMFGPNSKVQASGFGGAAGTIGVNATGIVDLQQGAIFDASGRSVTSNNSAGNVNINIVGSLVNNEGIIKANAITVDQNTGDVILALAKSSEKPVISSSGNDGGVIRLVANGQTRGDCVGCVVDKAAANGVVSAEEATAIKTRHDALVAAHDGDVVNTGIVQANGADATRLVTEYSEGLTFRQMSDYTPASSANGGNGGVIIASAARDIINDGLIQANGGNGANASNYSDDISLSSKSRYQETSSLAGKGGNGGIISLSAVNTVTNGTTLGKCKISEATIEANGGKGGDNTSTTYDYDSAYHGKGITTVSLGQFDSKAKAEDAASKQAPKVFADAYADASDDTGAQGGAGGAIGISYGNKLVNNGTIAAKGGDGGKGADADATANAYTNTSVKYTYSYKEKTTIYNFRSKKWDILETIKTGEVIKAENAFAKAVATGGNGGAGGKGGLVVLSGPANPTGNGIINVNGGNGGNGGNADASATAKADGKFAYSKAEAYAYGGAGGSGGKAGYVVAPSTSNTFNYTAKDGNSGIAGEAHANAVAYSDAKAYAKGNDQSTAKASAYTHNASVTVVNPTFDWSNNPLIQTQSNELLVQGSTAFLMSKGKNYTNLSDRLDNAVVRTVSNPFGDDLPIKGLAPIRHFAVASIVAKPAFNLDKPSSRLINLNGLTSLTVTTTGDVNIPAGTLWTAGSTNNWWHNNKATGGGHISITAPNGTLINGGSLLTFGTNTGGSISLAAREIKNGLDVSRGASAGYIITNGLIHGGSIILKGKDAVENLAVGSGKSWAQSVISTGVFPPVMGGTIRLQSLNGRVFNEGAILANGWSQGGIIVAKAGTFAFNAGTVQAKAYGVPTYTGDDETGYARKGRYSEEESDTSLSGNGGFIRWHGNALSMNGSLYHPEASMDVTGPSRGGIIQLTAGGPTPFDPDLMPLLFNGFGITQGTMLPVGNLSEVNSLGVLPLGSALNTGVLDARATNDDGITGHIDIAGDAFAGLESIAKVNGVTVGTDSASFFANPNIGGYVRLVAGEGAVKAVVCGGDLPENPSTPTTPFTPQTPDTPTTVSLVNPSPFNYDVKGLPFQYYRPDLINPPINHKLVLRLGRGSSFLAKAYSPVTQEILTLALHEYNRELSFGETINKAMESTTHYLKDSGINSDIAAQLVEAIKAGSFKAETPVVKALQALGAQGGEVIRQ